MKCPRCGQALVDRDAAVRFNSVDGAGVVKLYCKTCVAFVLELRFLPAWTSIVASGAKNRARGNRTQRPVNTTGAA